MTRRKTLSFAARVMARVMLGSCKPKNLQPERRRKRGLTGWLNTGALALDRAYTTWSEGGPIAVEQW